MLETQFPAAVETQPELLAQHYMQAGLSVQTIPYWQRAGQHASDRSAYLEAISHVTIYEALALVHALSHAYSLALAQCFAAYVYQFRRSVPAAYEHAEVCIDLAAQQGFPQWVVLGTSMRGWVLAMQGRSEEGMAQIRQGMPPGRPLGQH